MFPYPQKENKGSAILNSKQEGIFNSQVKNALTIVTVLLMAVEK